MAQDAPATLRAGARGRRSRQLRSNRPRALGRLWLRTGMLSAAPEVQVHRKRDGLDSHVIWTRQRLGT